MEKFCKDCRFAVNDGSEPEGKEASFLACSNERVSPRAHPEYLVTGIPQKTYCTTERGALASKVYPCGREGLLWEPKEDARPV